MPKRKYTKEIVSEAAAKSRSVMEVLDNLGLRRAGGSHSFAKSLLLKFEIDTSHFVGGHYNHGKPSPSRKTWQEILVLRPVNSRPEEAFRLKRALIESGVPYTCSGCYNDGAWNGKKLNLQIHHENGKRWDDRKENLKFLCPNCHSQTENFGSKNARLSKLVDEPHSDCGAGNGV